MPVPQIAESLDALVSRDDVRRLVHLNLTVRQAEVFLYLFRFTEAHGYQPSMKMAAVALGKANTTSVVSHYAGLARKGWIARDRGCWRAVRFARTPTGARFRGLVAREPAPPRPDRRPLPGQAGLPFDDPTPTPIPAPEGRTTPCN